MSFILDELKKSESERQRKGTPGIADVPHSSARSSGKQWAWITGILLSVNLAVLGVLMMRSDPVPPAQESASTEQPPGAEAEPPSERFAEIVADAKSKQPEATVGLGDALHTESPLPSPGAGQENAGTGRATVVDGLPSFNELRANGTLQMADLHLDIHVYSSTPSERFVFINMSRYKEQATLAEGPEILEITPDGVVLEHLGTRFLLPRE